MWKKQKKQYKDQKIHALDKSKNKTISLGFNNYGLNSIQNDTKTRSNETDKTPHVRGVEQHEKDQSVKLESDKQRVDELVKKSNRSIFKISTFFSSIFPWNLFASSINVEESRITFIFRQPLASQSHSLDIKDVSNVFIESSFFFATLQVVSRTYIQNDIKIRYLRKAEAIKMRIIIEGIRTFTQHNINTTNYEIKELVSKLEELQSTPKQN